MNQDPNQLTHDRIYTGFLRCYEVMQRKNHIKLTGATCLATGKYQPVIGDADYSLFAKSMFMILRSSWEETTSYLKFLISKILYKP